VSRYFLLVKYDTNVTKVEKFMAVNIFFFPDFLSAILLPLLDFSFMYFKPKFSTDTAN